MKYVVTLNGKKYEVEVEKGTASAVCVGEAKADEVTAAPSQAQSPAPQQTPSSSVGERIMSPMPGTILDVRCANGQQVKRGDILFILEAMKMENEIFAPKDGTVSALSASKGQTVETGTVLCTIV